MKIKIEVSNRHMHLCKEDINKLFKEGYELTKLKELSQPGEFACNETVDVTNAGNVIENVRILGPSREKSQLEISLTDARKLKLDVPVRASGDTDNVPSVEVVGPGGKTQVPVIIAKRHLHLSEEEAKEFAVKDKDIVKVKVDGEREIIFGNILVRINKNFKSALHLDTDEANAAGIKGECFGEIIY